MSVGLGFMEILLVLVSGGGLFSGGVMLGMPPGERDAALIKCAPAETLLYSEWSSRSMGKVGAPGIDGLAADPEVREFLTRLDQAVMKMVERETANGQPEEQVLGRVLHPLIKTLLMKPGCLYASLDSEAAAKASEQDDSPLASGGALLAGLRATLIVNAGDDADAMQKQIGEILDVLAMELTIERSADLQKQKIPLPLPVSLTLHRHKTYFILGLGEGTIDGAIAGLSGKGNGLSDSKRFTAAVERVQMERTAGVCWLDVKGIVTGVSQSLGLQGAMIVGMARMTGADAVDSLVSSTGVVEGQIRAKTFITTGGKTDGILALAAGRKIEADDFNHIPADADLVMAASLSAPKILAAAREIIGNADPQSKENFDEIIEQLEQELGVSLEEDVLAAFGDLWTLYDSPSAGGLLISAPVLSLEVRDADKADKVFAQLMKVIEQALPGERGNQFRRRAVLLEQREFLDRTIYFINTVGDDVPIAPAFCLTDEQLLVSLHPQPLKAHLRFLASDDKRFSARIDSELKLPEGDLLGVSYCDAERLLRTLYGFAPYFGQLIFSEMQGQGFEIDIFSLPSARAILPYVGTSLSAVARTETGILIDSQSALPLPLGSLGPFAVPILGLVNRPASPLGGPRGIIRQAVPLQVNPPARLAP